jgi:protein TonB
MAQSSTLPDPSQPNSREPTRASEPGASVVDLARFLGDHGAGASSAGLALDLVLNQIATEACQATNATGAAVALASNGEFVCRAVAGQNAPETGSRLSKTSGLTAACIDSREVQRCDNPETDHRVDAAACQRLGVQSVLVVPLLRGRELLGILEIFSSMPYAFSDREARTLEGFARRVVETIAPDAGKVENVAPPQNSAEAWSQLENISTPATKPEAPAPPLFAAIADAEPRQQGRDIWTSALTAIVIGLALLLGWMLAHTSWRGFSTQPSAPAPESSTRTPSNPANGAASTGLPSTIGRDESAVAHDVPHSPPASGSPPVTARPAAGPGGLTVYEGGKIVFEMKPAPGAGGVAKHARVPPGAADAFVLRRVEPQYPEQARLEHVQGAVVLLVQVNKNGLVEAVQTLSGDARLAAAASDAVRQWRFKPYAPRGQALDFETQITVDFKLP